MASTKRKVEIVAGGCATRVVRKTPRESQPGPSRRSRVAARRGRRASVLVVEHRQPVAGRLDAPLDLEDGRIERQRGLEVGGPCGHAERRGRTPRHGEAEGVAGRDVGRGNGTRRSRRPRLCRLAAPRPAAPPAAACRRARPAAVTTTVSRVVGVGDGATAGARAGSPCRAAAAARRERRRSIRGWLPPAPGRRRGTGRSPRRRVDEVVTRRELEHHRRDRRREVDDEAPVVEPGPEPERLARRVERDAAPRDRAPAGRSACRASTPTVTGRGTRKRSPPSEKSVGSSVPDGTAAKPWFPSAHVGGRDSVALTRYS